jgi:hypothetical protein
MEYSVYARMNELIDWTHIKTYDNIDEARELRALLNPYFAHLKITVNGNKNI